MLLAGVSVPVIYAPLLSPNSGTEVISVSPAGAPSHAPAAQTSSPPRVSAASRNATHPDWPKYPAPWSPAACSATDDVAAPAENSISWHQLSLPVQVKLGAASEVPQFSR